ncbi:ATP-binding cassette domain-containing protein [Candidatus Babeliales bacterium]|nr:ATP-binding cassette domain-containing protein [Candidatus Babeliales bacterium]
MIKLTGLKKAFGAKIITNGLDLEVNDGEFLAVIGRSGEGKSVLLKQIIGLLTPDEGSIEFNGKELTTLGEQERDEIFGMCGYVFQFAALLDSITVFENIGIGLLEDGIPEKEVRPIVAEKIQCVGLAEDVIDKYPSELSGGMKKRVGLARTLMRSPSTILYDEPTTGLDPISVRRIHELMHKTHKETNATTIVISHDVEIFNYADHVAMLYGGKVVYKGPSKNIWECDNEFVHQFIRGLPEGPIKHTL